MEEENDRSPQIHRMNANHSHLHLRYSNQPPQKPLATTKQPTATTLADRSVKPVQRRLWRARCDSKPTATATATATPTDQPAALVLHASQPLTVTTYQPLHLLNSTGNRPQPQPLHLLPAPPAQPLPDHRPPTIHQTNAMPPPTTTTCRNA
jgi:hypothetical protein